MRTPRLLFLTMLCSAVVCSAFGAPAPADPADVANLMSSLHGNIMTTEAPLVLKTNEGHIRFIGAPPGGYFRVEGGAKAGSPETLAKTFVASHKGAFGVDSSAVSFQVERVKTSGPRNYVRMRQVYGGVPVFGAQINVQINDAANVGCVLSDVMRDTVALDRGDVTVAASIPAIQAEAAAKTFVLTLGIDEVSAGSLYLASNPELVVYQPSVIGAVGPTRLVWRMTVASNQSRMIREVVLLDAHTKEIAFHYSRVYDAKQREIYDTLNALSFPGDLVRREGDPPTSSPDNPYTGGVGIPDADDAYDYLGDTYDFYSREHSRDSINGGGSTLIASVRLPYLGASYIGDGMMLFGYGMVGDDVAAHELTHGVTDMESGLIYANESGAINESFSDIWGEFVDLKNEKGNDSDPVRWLLGEDTIMGVIRDMMFPTAYGQPDRLGSSNYYAGFEDNGGVHINSGIGNKLCYLLTDGDTFNGQTVRGMGIETVADLFYELQTNLLTEASDYYDMYGALAQATINLGYGLEDRLNVAAACKAVEIEPFDIKSLLTGFHATPYGDNIVLTWRLPSDLSAITSVAIRRQEGRFPTGPNDGEPMTPTNPNYLVDEFVTPGRDYFYGVFLEVRDGFPQVSFSRTTAGGPPPDYFTEIFTQGSGLTKDGHAKSVDNDLAFTQLEFSPVGVPGTGLAGGYADYANYVGTIRHNVHQLPVARTDVIALPLTDDGYIWISTDSPIPYFGKYYSRFILGSNGFVAFDSSSATDSLWAYSPLNFPSLMSHFNLPRISFLFGDINPNGMGQAWMKGTDDRVVITFEKVPEWGRVSSNTVQLELFYSGHIRITYQELDIVESLVGLSDGKGLPPDPTAPWAYPPDPNAIQTDLSALPGQRNTLTILPVAPQFVKEGGLVTFTVGAVSPNGTPLIKLDWDRLEPVPFVDNLDGTATFTWNAPYDGAGNIPIRVFAEMGLEKAYQEVIIHVTDVYQLPEVISVEILPGAPDAQPLTQCEPGQALFMDYDYSHPEEDSDPVFSAEGNTTIYWFRNDVLIPAFTNRRQVVPAAVRLGDVWNCVVIPRTIYGFEGEPQSSQRVEIVEHVDVPLSAKADINLDGYVDAVDVQLVVNGSLGMYIAGLDANVDRASGVNAVDVQSVINVVLKIAP